MRLPLQVGPSPVGLTLEVPQGAEVGRRGVVDLVERDEQGRGVGEVDVDVDVEIVG